MDPQFQAGLKTTFFDSSYSTSQPDLVTLLGSDEVVDESEAGPMATYNWELFFFIPTAIASNLAKSQRFAEAQRWYHLVFNPLATDQKYWQFLRFPREVRR